jgi:diguanylate cyclase (GGDEF)-like protein/PAS domain S-box-containing protein
MHDPLNLFRAILSGATDFAIIALDTNNTIVFWNVGAERILQYKQNEIVGQGGETIFIQQDRDQDAPKRELEHALKDGRTTDNRWHQRKDGTQFWGEGVVTPIFDENGIHMGFLKILRDMTERKRTEDEMYRLANYDCLTGLANRALFQKRISEMISIAIRNNQLLIVQVVDFDNFKQINDSLGHPVGDILLKQAAQRMRDATREGDFIARLGGDEFVILQADAPAPEYGEALASKLLHTLSDPFRIEGRDVLMTVSIGLVVCPQDGTDPEQLLKKADLALYRVKGVKNSFSYFTDQMDAEAHRRQRRIAELRRSVSMRSFSLRYQPEIDAANGCVVSAEALLRCHNPFLSQYPTEDLISLGIETGLMGQIGSWVLSEACRQNREWQDAGLPAIRVSINFCPHEIGDVALPEKIDAVLEQTGISARHLEIEITERQIFSKNGNGRNVIDALRERGVTVVLDDFGAGYSALNSLRYIPIDRLKLDRIFLQEIPQDFQSCAIAKAIIAMAHTLNIGVVAEGIESAAQFAFCRAEGCDVLQGNFLGAPSSPEEIAALLSHQKHTGHAISVN